MSFNATTAFNQKIDGNGQLERDLTAQIAFPKEVQFLEAADLLEDQFGSRAIHGIMPLGGNRMQVTFNTPAFVNHAINKGLKCRLETLEFKEISRPSIWVTIRNCPLEMSSEVVGNLISQYGPIEQNFKEMDRRRGWFNGNRKIKMKMTKPIPNILRIGIYTIYISYDGVEQLCRRCLRPNHQAFECTTPFCHKCKSMGHLLAVCPLTKRRTEPEKEATETTLIEPQQPLNKEQDNRDNNTEDTTAECCIENWADEDLIDEILREDIQEKKEIEVPEFCTPSLTIAEILTSRNKSPTRETTRPVSSSTTTSSRTQSVSPDRTFASAVAKVTRSKSVLGKPYPFPDKESEKLSTEISERKLAMSSNKHKKKRETKT